MYLFGRRVRPEDACLLVLALDEEDAQQVGEATVLASLGVEKQLDRLPRDVGRAVDVYLLFSQSKRLQGWVAYVVRPLDPLAFLLRAEGAGQLGKLAGGQAVAQSVGRTRAAKSLSLTVTLIRPLPGPVYVGMRQWP